MLKSPLWHLFHSQFSQFVHKFDFCISLRYTEVMNEATTPQKDFLVALLRDREVPAELRAELNARWSNLTKAEASVAIGTLKELPFARRTSFASDALADLPKSFYAIPSLFANSALTDLNIDNDLLFVVIDEFRGTRYMRQVHGSVGDFNRSRMSARDVRAIANILKTDSLLYITLFGEHFSVCGKCGARLTDEKSRQTGFGPDCRKALGIR